MAPPTTNAASTNSTSGTTTTPTSPMSTPTPPAPEYATTNPDADAIKHNERMNANRSNDEHANVPVPAPLSAGQRMPVNQM